MMGINTYRDLETAFSLVKLCLVLTTVKKSRISIDKNTKLKKTTHHESI
jgi:hypothetical protein